jgi:hypothetical protein
MPRLFRRVLILLLATVLAATTAMAQPPGDPLRSLRPALSDSADLFARLWSLLARPWKNGCQVDPSGPCLPRGSGVAAEDNGCEVDPNGFQCRATKNGCSVDPDGRCVP